MVLSNAMIASNRKDRYNLGTILFTISKRKDKMTPGISVSLFQQQSSCIGEQNLHKMYKSFSFTVFMKLSKISLQLSVLTLNTSIPRAPVPL